ncbi:hypothetical protein [uncultured Tateyamaria sp.]|uniref:hypothetical protein n=1 Tax=Tateyamaria sp. 1078 TaxID=3417464 RepID=UPI00260725F4|nr:hypothetical protein [uncultured Tateyamaria sp.]
MDHIDLDRLRREVNEHIDDADFEPVVTSILTNSPDVARMLIDFAIRVLVK